MQVEAGFQFGLPLFDQMWRAENGQPGNFAAVQQFTDDQAGLNGFAHPHVIGNQKTYGGQAQGHQQRDQLVAARFHGNVAE